MRWKFRIFFGDIYLKEMLTIVPLNVIWRTPSLSELTPIIFIM